MKLKKFISLLSSVTLLITSALVTPVFAQEPSNTFEDYEIYYEQLFNEEINNTIKPQTMSEEAENIPFYLTTFKDNTWNISISPKMVSSSWDDSDKISVANFDYMNIENPTGSLIELSCEEEKYVRGSVIRLFIDNETQDEQKEIEFNFTKEDIPTFPSWSQAIFYVEPIKTKFADEQRKVIVDASLQEDIQLSEDTFRSFSSSSFR